MTLDELILRTEIFIDEASKATSGTGSLSGDKKPLKKQLEIALENAKRPLYLDVNPMRVRCIDIEHEDLVFIDGIGVVEVPYLDGGNAVQEIIKVKQIALSGWSRDVVNVFPIGSPEYKRQQNEFTRATYDMPIVIQEDTISTGGEFYTFSLYSPKNLPPELPETLPLADTLTKFDIIWNWSFDDVQDDFIDALCWGAAKYYFSIISNQEIPAMIIENYNQRLI